MLNRIVCGKKLGGGNGARRASTARAGSMRVVGEFMLCIYVY